MDEILKAIATNAPGPVVCLLAFIVFLKYLKEERIGMTRFFERLHSEHVDERRLSREAIDKNTETIERNIASTQHNSDTMATLETALRRATR